LNFATKFNNTAIPVYHVLWRSQLSLTLC